MKRWPLVALVLVAGAAVAGERVKRPPAQFRGDGWALVRWVDITQVDGACRELGAVRQPNERIEGCARGRQVIIPNACLFTGYFADLICHEGGHVQGWPGDHPGEADLVPATPLGAAKEPQTLPH